MSNSSQHGESNCVSKFGFKFLETSDPGVAILKGINRQRLAGALADLDHDSFNAYIIDALVERSNPEEIELHKSWFVGHMAVRLANKVERFARQSYEEYPATSVIVPLIDAEFARWTQIEPKFRGHVARILSNHAGDNSYIPLKVPTLDTTVEATYGNIFVNNKFLYVNVDNQPQVSDFNFIKLVETKE